MRPASISIPPAEFDARAETLRAYVNDQDLTGVVLFDRGYILYYSGFAFAPTERPIAFMLNANGDKGLFVPRLELEHARNKTGYDLVASYVEYPYQPHPMEILKATLDEMGIQRRVGTDMDGYPWIFGYRGPTLSQLTGATIVLVAGFIEDQMAVKSQNEINLIKESVTWGNLAHRLLQRFTQVGATETEVSLRASHEATLAMLEALGPLYQSQSLYGDGAHAGYRGQIGRNAAIPHALANNITFQAGDVLVTGASAAMWGYNSELERTMLIGPATLQQRQMFEWMLGAQDTAFAAIRPGHTCADVDRAVRRYYESNDLMPYWRHHTGHAIGLRYHEGPFLDIGDETPLMPGMLFTIEPGLYAPDLGGFRHSDTVLVTEDGMEMLTYYPRDLESLTIPL